MRASTLAAALIVSVGAALAQCPAEPGFWPSSHVAGSRMAESFCGADGESPARGAAGNMVSIHSWDGQSLGAHWRFRDLQVDDDGSLLVIDEVDGDGNGWRLYRNNFVGGRFELCGCSPWSDGPEDIVGRLFEAEAFTLVTYLHGELFDVTATYGMLGTIDSCAEMEHCLVEFEIRGAYRVWAENSDDPIPGDYPPFECPATRGELLDAAEMTIHVIWPLVGVEAATWGALKARYR